MLRFCQWMFQKQERSAKRSESPNNKLAAMASHVQAASETVFAQTHQKSVKVEHPQI